MPRELTAHCRHLIAVAHEVAHALPDTDVKAAVLFGSSVWGDADAASDLDIFVIVDGPDDCREVTRVRVADIIDRTPSSGPHFVDLDRISAANFERAVAGDGYAYRLVNSVALRDTDGYYAAIRERVTREFYDPLAVAHRFARARQFADTERTAALSALRAADRPGEILHARLAVKSACNAILDFNEDRVSATHLVESTLAALSRLGGDDLAAPVLAALGLDVSTTCDSDVPEAFRPWVHTRRLPRAVARSLAHYDALAQQLKAWMDEPDAADVYSTEDRAWAVFTYAETTYQEMAHKVDAFIEAGRYAALQFYLDELMHLTIRINMGRAVAFKTTGAPRRLTVGEFHAALRAFPDLEAAWLDALRLNAPTTDAWAMDVTASQVLALGERAVAERMREQAS